MVKLLIITAKLEDGKDLRKQVSKLTKHSQVCSLDTLQLCKEVAPNDVLSGDEFKLVCKSVGQQEKESSLTEICNEITPRVLLKKRQNESQSEKKQFELQFSNHKNTLFWQEFNFSVVTRQCDIELLPLECPALGRHPMTAEGATYEVSCTTTITRITDHQNDTSTETPVTVRFNQLVECGTTFMIPLTSGGDNVTLLPNNRYTFSMVFGGNQPMYWDEPETHMYENSHLSLIINPYRDCHYWVPMNSLKYKASDA